MSLTVAAIRAAPESPWSGASPPNSKLPLVNNYKTGIVQMWRFTAAVDYLAYALLARKQGKDASEHRREHPASKRPFWLVHVVCIR